MLPPSARDLAFSRFAGAFPAANGIEAAFDRFFSEKRPTHEELVQFAQAPNPETGARSGTWRCPLCQCPVQDSHAVVSDALAVRIRRDFPSWQRETGACLRCRELYEPALLRQLD
jgi:hypothetical protein